MGKLKKRSRLVIQIVWTVVTNSFLAGFARGRIYTGKLKSICLPGLNCYSCPGSIGSCPIGALQAVLSSAKHTVPLYLLGFFLLLGTVLGRFVCGFLCPFGLVQDLLNKIPFPKKIRTFSGDRALRYIKYGILAVFVIILPLMVVDAAGNGSPWFCKWICPAGSFGAGIPLVIASPVLREIIGFLFAWKLAILAITVIASIIIFRPFCRYVCPLGAIYALFNRIAVYHYNFDAAKCTGCDVCSGICPMAIKPAVQINHAECVRCGKCKSVCPTGAVTSGFRAKRTK